MTQEKQREGLAGKRTRNQKDLEKDWKERKTRNDESGRGGERRGLLERTRQGNPWRTDEGEGEAALMNSRAGSQSLLMDRGRTVGGRSP